MQKRERLLAGAVALLMGGWLIDSMVVQPTLGWFAAVEKQTRAATNEVAEAKALIDRQPQIVNNWRTQQAAGLLDNADQARFRLQRTLANEANASGFMIDSVSGGQVIPAANDQIYDILRLGISGRGSHEQVTAFIARLEQSAMPLAIERSEWSSSDARKNNLDISLTVSTRLVSDSARAGRSVPEGTKAWEPETRDDHFDHETLAAKPFLADRRPQRAEPMTKKTETVTPPPPKVVDPGWGLVGIVTTNGQSVAFIRHLGHSEERQVTAGETIDAYSVTTVDASGILVKDSVGERHIVVGNSFQGEAIVNKAINASAAGTSNGSSSRSGKKSDKTHSAENIQPKSDSQDASGISTTPTTTPATTPPTTPTTPTTTPFTVPAPNADPAKEAILERLRQQRGRSN